MEDAFKVSVEAYNGALLENRRCFPTIIYYTKNLMTQGLSFRERDELTTSKIGETFWNLCHLLVRTLNR